MCVLGVRSAQEREFGDTDLSGQIAEAAAAHWTPYRIEHLQVISAPGRRRPAEPRPVMPGERGALQALFDRRGLYPENTALPDSRLSDQLLVKSLPEPRSPGVRLLVELNISTLRRTPSSMEYVRSRMEATARCVHNAFFGRTRGRDFFGLTFAETQGEPPPALARVRTLVEALLARHMT